MTCPICNFAEATVSSHPTRDASVVDCPQCGEYQISRTAVVKLKHLDNKLRWKVSAWINEFGPDTVSSSDVEQALASTVPSLHHRADRMLRWLVKEFPVGTKFSLSELGLRKQSRETFHGRSVVLKGQIIASELMAMGWNHSLDEMNFMVTEVLLKEMGLLTGDGHYFQISPKGLIYLEGRRNAVSPTAFCAMWFSQEVLPL